MAGQVVLYSTKFSCFARQQVEPAQPASRPQAARSRVACALAVWKPHSGREAERKPALPAEAVCQRALPAGPTNANDGLAVSTARIASLTES